MYTGSFARDGMYGLYIHTKNYMAREDSFKSAEDVVHIDRFRNMLNIQDTLDGRYALILILISISMDFGKTQKWQTQNSRVIFDILISFFR